MDNNYFVAFNNEMEASYFIKAKDKDEAKRKVFQIDKTIDVVYPLADNDNKIVFIDCELNPLPTDIEVENEPDSDFED